MQALSEKTSEKRRICIPVKNKLIARTFTEKPVLRLISLKEVAVSMMFTCVLSSTLRLLCTELHSAHEATEVAILK